MKIVVIAFLTVFACSSCHMSTWDQNFVRSFKGKLAPATTAPRITRTSNVASKVDYYTSRGYTLLGFTEVNVRGETTLASSQLLALGQQKGADLVVYNIGSQKSGSYRTQVPVSSNVTTAQGGARAAYGNNYGYRSAAAAQYGNQQVSTNYVFQNVGYKYRKVSAYLFVKNSRILQMGLKISDAPTFYPMADIVAE